MGMYDTYVDISSDISIQLKAGECLCQEFHVGHKVDIPDGVYIGYGGAVVVKSGKLVMVTNQVLDKYGCPLDVQAIVDSTNPLASLVKEIKEAHDKKPND